MKDGADVEARGRGSTEETPLNVAAEFQHVDCVEVLLDKYKASINATNKYGHTALHRAASAGSMAVVMLLTSYSQCDVNAMNQAGQTAAILARSVGQNDIADYLTSQSSVASVTSTMAESDITDKKGYGKFFCKQISTPVF